MTSIRGRDEIPLADAALRLRKGYLAARDMVLRGEISGRRNERGLWVVSLASIEAIEAAAQPLRAA